MQFLKTDSNLDFKDDYSPDQRLRMVERQFGVKLQDWHFKLVNHIEPVKVYAWFGNAKFMNGTIYYDGKASIGKTAFNWVQERYKGEIYAALGNTEVALAKDGEIIKSFKVGKLGNGYLTKAEVELMFKLSGRAMGGEKFDAEQELENFRRAA